MVLPFGLNPENTATNRGLTTPSAPPIEVDNVHHSPYVDFLLVNENDKDKYMVRAERKAILESSVELAKIINSGATVSGRKNDNHFIINNINKIDFELAIRYLETKFIKFRDHSHVLRILEVADRFNCPDLVIHCVKELDLQLSSMNVLDVFRSLWYYNCVALLKSAVITTQEKSKSKKTQSPPPPFTPEEHLVALLNNTLQLIDMQAELILTKSEMLDLRFEEIEMIAKRDALQMQSETVLFNCLADWSSEESKRKKLDLTAENRRRVLGPLCYAPRYLTMTPREYRTACERVELLDPFEIKLISEIMDGKKQVNLTNEQSAMVDKLKTPRPAYARLPIHLSDRSNPKNYSKKMRRAADRTNEEGCWESFGLNCLAIFACIFD